MARSVKVDGIPIIEANRFSCFVRETDRGGYQDLLSWKAWFQSRGIACTIALTDNGYAVYRLGLQDDDL